MTNASRELRWRGPWESSVPRESLFDLLAQGQLAFLLGVLAKPLLQVGEGEACGFAGEIAVLVSHQGSEARCHIRTAGLDLFDPLEHGHRLGHEALGGELVGQAQEDRKSLLSPSGQDQNIGELKPLADAREAPLNLGTEQLDGFLVAPTEDEMSGGALAVAAGIVVGHCVGPQRCWGTKVKSHALRRQLGV